MEFGAEEWGRKGATLSDKMARSEYGLTQGRSTRRSTRSSSSLRREVEDPVATRSGDRYLRERKARTELAQVNRAPKQLQAQLAALEKRTALLAELAELVDEGDHQARPASAPP